MYDDWDGNEEEVSNGGCFGDLCYRGGRKSTVFLKITVPCLASLFGACEETIRRWIRSDKINPTSLIDIIEKYNNRSLLDKRRK